MSGTATRLEWPPGSDESIAVPVRVEVHSHFAAVEPITAGVARDIIMQDRLDGIYIYDDAHAWEGLTYIPVPGRPVNPIQLAAVAQPLTSIEVSPVVSIHVGKKPRRAACPGRARHVSNNTKLSVRTQMWGPRYAALKSPAYISLHIRKQSHDIRLSQIYCTAKLPAACRCSCPRHRNMRSLRPGYSRLLQPYPRSIALQVTGKALWQ